MNTYQAIGQKIINAIVDGSLIETKAGGRLIVWKQNADEQIGQLARDVCRNEGTPIKPPAEMTDEELAFAYQCGGASCFAREIYHRWMSQLPSCR